MQDEEEMFFGEELNENYSCFKCGDEWPISEMFDVTDDALKLMLLSESDEDITDDEIHLCRLCWQEVNNQNSTEE